MLFERCFHGRLDLVGTPNPVLRLPLAIGLEWLKLGRSDRPEVVLTATFEEFVREHLPAPPARVLDVGCGQGELTTALAVAGYDVLGIDPLAPSGELFRRLKLEDVEDNRAVRRGRRRLLPSPHPRPRRRARQDRRAPSARRSPRRGRVRLGPPGRARRSTGSTASGGRSRPRATATCPSSHDELRREWEAEHLGLHGFAALREGLDARFDEREFAWAPHLHRTLAGVATEVLEQALIDAGAIQALGFRYAGVVRPV